MIKNYLKIAFRNIWKSKGYAFINIVGLSVAFCISVFLFLTAYFQLSYDDFHEDGDRIYRTYFWENDPEKIVTSTSMPLPLAPTMKSEFPEVEGAARILNNDEVIEYKGRYFDKNVRFTDPDFFKIFSFPLLNGNKESVLNNLSGIVLSKSSADAIFGKEDPMGKAVFLGLDQGKKQYVVTGVVADHPENSTLQYDAFVRIENASSYQEDKNQWDSNNHPVYVKLKPNVDRSAFEKRLKPFTQKYLASSIETLKRKGGKANEQGELFSLRLQKLSDVRFGTELSGKGSGTTPKALVYSLIGIAIFILLIACINFINLNIARSFIRAREVGVRKALGALKNQLFVQIWGEAGIICFFGFVVGIILSILLLPSFNAQFNAKLSLDYMFEPDKIALILLLFAVVTLVAGGYPAWQMSKFNAVEVLKGKLTLKKPGLLRNALIVTQFTLSSLLICCTIIAFQQVKHLREQPLGFSKEEVISIPVGSKIGGKQTINRLRNKLNGDPGILSITGSGVNLGLGLDGSSSRSIMGFTYNEKEVKTDWLGVDYDYFKTLNIKMLDGRDFSPSSVSDSSDRVIITESMAKMMGETNPVGKYFQLDSAGAKIQVIGLISDYNLYSSKADKFPITIHLSNHPSYIFVRVAPQSLSVSMDKLREVWKEIAPESEFMGSFLDENTNKWFKEEQRLSQVFSLASGIAILLSCLGLFAVAMIVIAQRTKEIGVRKVLGASIASLVLVLSKDFVKLVIISIVIATPLAWYLMQQWLDNYSYRIDINPMIFVGVGLSAILVAIGTVSFQSIKTALLNPVDSLKSE